MRASSRRKPPAGVSPSGSPAELSAVTPCRASSAETRRARSRSGVTRATRAFGSSSASRRVSAIATASAWASGAVSWVRPSSAGRHSEGRRDCQAGRPAAGRSAMPSSAGPARHRQRHRLVRGQPGQRCRSSCVAPSRRSSRCWPQRDGSGRRGWRPRPAARGCRHRARAAPRSLAAGRWRPRAAAPRPPGWCRRRRCRRRSPGRRGGSCCQARVCARSAWARRMPISSSPASASQSCHCGDGGADEASG